MKLPKSSITIKEKESRWIVARLRKGGGTRKKDNQRDRVLRHKKKKIPWAKKPFSFGERGSNTSKKKKEKKRGEGSTISGVSIKKIGRSAGEESLQKKSHGVEKGETL